MYDCTSSNLYGFISPQGQTDNPMTDEDTLYNNNAIYNPIEIDIDIKRVLK